MRKQLYALLTWTFPVLLFAGNPAAHAQAGKVFSVCQTCHSTNSGGKHGIGPNLNGLFTRPAASAKGFKYSAALQRSGMRWDDKTLDAYLAGPQKKVPGTRMTLAIANAVRRSEIIAYLKVATKP